jgi:hypothetical protein
MAISTSILTLASTPISTPVSSFELLVKPLVPAAADILGAGRTVIQGYFLTISNLNTVRAATLRVNFKAQSPNINSQPLLAFFDVNDINASVVPLSMSNTNLTFIITVPAGDTGLFILQPAVNQAQIVTDANTEIRGYVTVSLANPFGPNSYNLLLTPQQRGTFLPKGFTVPTPTSVATNSDFDQLAYGLPTATGGAQVTLSQINAIELTKGIPNLPALSELSTLDPELLQVIQENPNLLMEAAALSQLLNPINDNGSAIKSQPTDNRLEPVMKQIAERLERLERKIAN